MTACDPNFAADALLLHMDGTNGSTTFVDSSSYALTMTGSGSPVPTIDTSAPMFGTGAGSFGPTSFLTTPITSGGPLDLNYTSDFTIEGWIKFKTANFGNIVADNTVGTDLKWDINCSVGGISAFYVTSSGSQNAGGPSQSFTTATWYSFAVVVHSGVLTVYIDGVGGVPLTLVGTPVATSGSLQFGEGFGISNGANMELDEVRISNIARYTSNYTPAGPFGGACVTVPNVIGQVLATAESNIVAAPLTVGSVTGVPNLFTPVGDVISTSPVAGTVVSAYSPVNIVYSLGDEVAVPNLINLSLAAASALLVPLGLELASVGYLADVLIIPGNIDGQSIAAGTFVPAGTGIDVTISTGRVGLLIPNLIGLTELAAIELLISVGLQPGAISFAPSTLVPAGLVMLQNGTAGNGISAGGIVSFFVSTGGPTSTQVFDFEATVISQYANSPTLLQLVANMNQYIDQSANFANFYNYVWNVDTAVGFGLDIWGVIVGVSRLLQIPNTTDYVGFYQSSESQPDQDWQPMGSDQPPQPAVGGAMYTGYNATTAYLLSDSAYRQLILAKAFANIAATTAPAINQLLQNLYGVGSAWVLNTGVMAISYNFNFTPSAIQLAILEQSGIIPTPPGVSVVVNTDV